mmetsp:Transcript_132/g.292  ORF Transcript_132/g.292 Transcript_132/m.292 type:complete len:222 (+) Transcript_132:553-1218(+)
MLTQMFPGLNDAVVVPHGQLEGGLTFNLELVNHLVKTHICGFISKRVFHACSDNLETSQSASQQSRNDDVAPDAMVQVDRQRKGEHKQQNKQLRELKIWQWHRSQNQLVEPFEGRTDVRQVHLVVIQVPLRKPPVFAYGLDQVPSQHLKKHQWHWLSTIIVLWIFVQSEQSSTRAARFRMAAAADVSVVGRLGLLAAPAAAVTTVPLRLRLLLVKTGHLLD